MKIIKLVSTKVLNEHEKASIKAYTDAIHSGCLRMIEKSGKQKNQIINSRYLIPTEERKVANFPPR